MKRTLSLIAALSGACMLAAAPVFREAKPVWPAGMETQMNANAGFRAVFELKKGERPVLRIAGTSCYRIRLNGKYVGYGPARAAKGFFRVGEWPLKAQAREGRNVLAVDVTAYNVNNFYVPDQPGFLQAEVVVGKRVLARTGKGGTFEAVALPRVVKCSRYSYQRGFGEGYRVGADWDAWTTDAAVQALPLAEQPAKRLIDRIAPLPDQSVNDAFRPFKRTTVVRAETISYQPQRFIENFDKGFKAYRAADLELNIWRELQHMRVTAGDAVAPRKTYALAAGTGVIFDAGLNDTGFPGLTVTCTRPGRLWLVFDEILQGDFVNPLRYGVGNGIAWDLTEPGTYRLEGFEAYTFRYAHAFMLGGAAEISAPYIRSYKNPDAKKASFRSSDPDLDRIFLAARETFAQNAVDVFTDCPSRERAGWLCDSFFTGRVNALLTGSTKLERLFIQNYLLPKTFDDIPEGMLPMCYPSDHVNGNYIPNWAMWFVIELDEYLRRSGDRAMVDALRPRMLALEKFFERYENADGLLEKLPAWVFVEWSMANKLVQDVSYPSNMTWAEVLDCLARLYDMPAFAAKAAKVRETVRRQSWNGTWFCDNAVRQKDGSLKLSGQCTETCQYYAFFMHTATPETHPALWKTLVTDFGPDRRQTKKHPSIHFANAFIGNYLRLELLSRAGLGAQLVRETKGYFKYMADRTGTLWENDGPYASCNHGFASHAAVFYVRDVLGVKSVDTRTKTVTLADTDADLAFCEATLPVPGGALTVSRFCENGVRRHACVMPVGWRIAR